MTPNQSVWMIYEAGVPLFGTIRNDRPAPDVMAMRQWVELAPVLRLNQCAEVCERAKLCAICAAGIAPAEPVQEPVASAPSLEAAYAIGAKGGTAVEGERLALKNGCAATAGRYAQHGMVLIM